jgi:hypothetical protein
MESKKTGVFLESNNTSRSGSRSRSRKISKSRSRSRKSSKSSKRSKSSIRHNSKNIGKNTRKLNLKNMKWHEYTSVTVSLLNNKLQILNSIFLDYEVNVKELGNHSKSTQGIADYFIFKLNELVTD